MTDKKNIKFSLSTLTILLLALLGGSYGCGYGFQGGGTSLPPEIKSVAILPVENNTTESGLSIQFQEALRSRFERYGVLQVVDSEEDADSIMEVKIIGLTTRVKNTASKTDAAVTADLVMTVSAELRKRDGTVMWRDSKFQEKTSFAGTGDVVVTSSSDFAQGGISAGALGGLDTLEISRGQREQALADLSDEMARQLYLEAVAEDF